MHEMTTRLMLSGLGELGSIDDQKRLWLSDGVGGKEVSSFVEAVETLFSDSTLDSELRRGTTGLSDEAIALLKELGELITAIDPHRAPIELINSPSMDDVRRLALSARIACERDLTTNMR